MASSQFKILLVEDNFGYTELIRRMLKRVCGEESLVVVTRLSDARAQLKVSDFDLIILDLSLPDSAGLDTLAGIRDEAPSVPVVVTTGGEDDLMALKAVQMGAQDYLSKGNLTSHTLIRSVRYALERQRRLLELDKSRQKELNDRELEAIERIQRGSETGVTSQPHGRASLRDVAPDEFERLVTLYGTILEHALEVRGYRAEANSTGELRMMSDRLAFLKSGPRDVIEIHTASLKEKLESVAPQKAGVYVDEGRFLLLMLMGELVSTYRTQSLGTRGISDATAEPSQGD